MRIRLLLLACSLLLALSSACGAPYTFRGVSINPPDSAHDFTLTDYNGQPFRLSEQRGNVVLLFFGFTSCPEVCPTTLSDLQQAFERLGTDAERIKVAMVTVDPQRDTPDRLKQYVTAFDPRFVGLHGDQVALDPIFKNYGVTAIRRELPNSALNYTMDHSSAVYVVDQQGRLRVILPYGGEVDDVVSDLRYLAREGGA